MKKLIAILISLSFLLAGCEPLHNLVAAQNCYTDAAYAKGVNDGKANLQMLSSYYPGLCSADMQANLNDAYRKGYLFGLQQAAIMSSGTNVNIINKGSYSRHCITDNFGKVKCF